LILKVGVPAGAGAQGEPKSKKPTPKKAQMPKRAVLGCPLPAGNHKVLSESFRVSSLDEFPKLSSATADRTFFCHADQNFPKERVKARNEFINYCLPPPATSY